MSQAYRVLRVSFDTREDLDREFQTNLVNGGLFVPGHAELLYGEPVMVLVELDFVEASIELEGHVVQSVPVEFEESGAMAGVALELSNDPSEIRERLERATGEPLFDELANGSGNRVEPRAVARVRARVEVPGVSCVEGQTRNLSLAGVLVAIDGEAPPIGQDVRVTIVHPITEEERGLDGMIARHDLDSEGNVRGVGIQFTVEPEDQDAAIQYLNRVKASEHARRLGGITGTIETLGLPDLLMSFGQCVPRGRFTFMKSGEVGTVHVDGGLMVSAQMGAAVGVKALVRMVAWEGGRFEFHANVEPDRDIESTPMPVEAALLEAARLVDESQTYRESGLARQAGLRVEHRVADLDRFELTKVESRILDLAGTGATVARLLDMIQEPDGAIEGSILALVDRGILRIEAR